MCLTVYVTLEENVLSSRNILTLTIKRAHTFLVDKSDKLNFQLPIRRQMTGKTLVSCHNVS